jgi:hypothetical protein
MEVTLQDIIDAIENDDPDELKILLTHSAQINEYFEIENGVLMTPLLYAIKMKSPDCVDILILNGADPSLSLKIQEKNGERSLNTAALEYATGEKKNAAGEDQINYEDIILILKEKLNIMDSPPNTPSEIGDDDTVRMPVGSDPSLLSPSQTLNTHRLTQITFQNQTAIKKLTEENASLKKEIQQLRQEIERFKPWIERWIYESTPTSPAITIIEKDRRISSVQQQQPKKVRKKRATRDGSNGHIDGTLKTASSPKLNSTLAGNTDLIRPKSIMVPTRSESEKTHKIVKSPLKKKATVEAGKKPDLGPLLEKEEVKSPTTKKSSKKKE